MPKSIEPDPAVRSPSSHLDQQRRDQQFAIRLSLIFGVLMMLGKVAAYLLTGSAAILSDAAESIVHVVAVAFAAFSLWLSSRPANYKYLYGYERIAFFSAGVEGAMIVLAAIAIIYAAIQKWMAGLKLEHLGVGAVFVVAAAVVNLALGWYLVRTGRRTHSLILEADGKHVLTDSWTSFGVVGGLCLVLVTGWKPFDPLCAIAVALNIVWSGGRLIWRSATGLLDYTDPEIGRKLRQRLDQLSQQLGVQYHGLRYRTTGNRLLVEVHLLFPHQTAVGGAHRIATEIEERLPQGFDFPAEVITHLESLEDHESVHRTEH